MIVKLIESWDHTPYSISKHIHINHRTIHSNRLLVIRGIIIGMVSAPKRDMCTYYCWCGPDFGKRYYYILYYTTVGVVLILEHICIYIIIVVIAGSEWVSSYKDIIVSLPIFKY